MGNRKLSDKSFRIGFVILTVILILVFAAIINIMVKVKNDNEAGQIQTEQSFTYFVVHKTGDDLAPAVANTVVKPEQNEETEEAEFPTDTKEPEHVIETTETELVEEHLNKFSGGTFESKLETEPTPTPTPTPTPVEEWDPSAFVWPEATDEAPTIPVPEIDGTVIGSGSFRSDTFTLLNIVLEWKAVATNDSQVQIITAVKLESCSLQTFSNTVTLLVGDKSGSFNSPLLNLGGNHFRTSDLGNMVFTIDMAAGERKDISFQASWPFDGTYSGTAISVITCGGTVTLSR